MQFYPRPRLPVLDSYCPCQRIPPKAYRGNSHLLSTMSLPGANTHATDQDFMSQYLATEFGDDDFDLSSFTMPSEQDRSKNVIPQPPPQQQQQQAPRQPHIYISSSVGHGGQALGAMQPMSLAPNMAMSECVAGGMVGEGEMDSLAPKFPPQNFDVPDISLLNSVTSSGANIFQSLSSVLNTTPSHVSQAASGVYMGDMLTSSAPSTMHMTVVQTSSSQQQQQQQVGQLSTISQSQMAQHLNFQTALAMSTSPASSHSSSPGRETSEDSDDCLPLAQLVSMKRAASGVPMATGEPVPSVMLASVEARVLPGVSPSVQAGGGGPASDGSDAAGGSPAKKQRPLKKKKKKDPNEPQKPVSAYALFFRDTQAAIKGQNPSASFGEVSKIVASMWDGLDVQSKEVYKKKTELAKKEYLKQLAAYRASQVSQSAAEESINMEKSPSPPSLQPMTLASTAGTGAQAVNAVSDIHTVPQQQMQSQQLMGQYPSPPHLQEVPVSSYPNLASPTTLDPMIPSPHDNGLFPQPAIHEMPPHANALCVRDGCHNMAVENPGWDAEYCSNECVVTHCRDIFTAWVAARGGSSAFTVK
ncbi:thymocyte selection-associated high mobility group box protein TOX-like isoform X3 [Pomacea canaliculata]|nr:thymocyte selection-associated high mobility group box protein TOX-like isoform X3 [Pomacea canaliculata]